MIYSKLKIANLIKVKNRIFSPPIPWKHFSRFFSTRHQISSQQITIKYKQKSKSTMQQQHRNQQQQGKEEELGKQSYRLVDDLQSLGINVCNYFFQ